MAWGNEIINSILDLKKSGLSSRNICKVLGWPKSKKSTVNDIIKANQSKVDKDKKLKVFVLDVETSMHKGYFFKLFKENISIDAIEQFPYMLTFSGQWLGNEEIVGYKLPDFPLWKEDITNDKQLIEKLWGYLDDADIVVAHNSRFDDGWFTQQCILHGLPVPSPYKVICTYRALKSITSLQSKSLKYSTKYFRTLDDKLENDGIPLWIRCMKGEESAFDEMLTYNKGDIPTCRDLYLKIRPFMKNHPNVSIMYNDGKRHCNTCGSTDLNKLTDKFAHTNLSTFEVYRCECCGKIQRSGTALNDKEHRKLITRNIV